MQDIDLQGIAKSWEQTQVEIRGTNFEIRQMLAMDAFEVLERIRESLAGGMLQTSATGDSTEMVGRLISSVLSIPRESLAPIRDDMFRNVRFTNRTAKTPMIVHGNEGMAFNGLLPVHIYELLARALCVNFTESVAEILRRAGADN